MKYIRNYDSYKNQRVNEEFIGKLIKGSLSKLFQAFSAPWKDLVNDIKNSFKEDDPNSIKGIVMTNLNQAIDAAQKSLRDLKPPVEGKTGDNDPKPTDVAAVMDGFISSLTDLSNNIGKDFSTAIPDKGKSSAANEVAKAILIGDESAGWEGIIGYLNDPNYKYSKQKYNESLDLASKGKKNNNDIFKAKQNAAFAFFDNFQKDIADQFTKNFTEGEMKKIYNDAVKKGGGSTETFDYDALLKFKDDKTVVKYKLKGYDNSKKPELQPTQIGEKPIEEIDKEKETVTFLGKNNLRIDKKYSDILGPVKKEEEGTGENVNKEVIDNLKELSKDPKNIKIVKDVTDAIKKDPNIIDKIEEVLPKEELETTVEQ